MNYFLKQKTWFFIALFFLTVNVVLLCIMFMHRGHGRDRNFRGRERNIPEHAGPQRDYKEKDNRHRGFYMARMLADSLAFSEEQLISLRSINEALDAKKDYLIDESENTKELLAKEMYAAQPVEKKLDSLVKRISFLMESFNRIRIAQVNYIRGICNEEQKKKLPLFFNEFQNKRNHKRNMNH